MRAIVMGRVHSPQVGDLYAISHVYDDDRPKAIWKVSSMTAQNAIPPGTEILSEIVSKSATKPMLTSAITAIVHIVPDSVPVIGACCCLQLSPASMRPSTSPSLPISAS
jgi:hypothetical protein